MGVAGLGEPGLTVDGRSGLVPSGIESGKGDPLGSREVGGERRELGENHDGAERADALDAEQELVAACQNRVLFEQLEGCPQKVLVGLLEELQRALDVEPQGLWGGVGGVGGVESILLRGALGGDLLKSAAQSAQLQDVRSRSAPGLKGHAARKLFDHGHVEQVGLAALKQGFGEAAHRLGIDDHQSNVGDLVEGEGEVEPIGAGGLHADLDAAWAAHKADEIAVPGGGIEETPMRQDLTGAAKTDEQNLGANFDPTGVEVEHRGLLSLGSLPAPRPCTELPPTL